jgi:hypothetical protein
MHLCRIEAVERLEDIVEARHVKEAYPELCGERRPVMHSQGDADLQPVFRNAVETHIEKTDVRSFLSRKRKDAGECVTSRIMVNRLN